ncbi:MAG: glycoside hydrolase family 88 protein, partial [Bacilli bacterium]|nr:glycoside hydrolase family 88 protein [Bacilli bacterium]
MYEQINKYIDTLIKFSKPNAPLWNIESMRSNRSPSWNYVDGCMMTSLLELYKTTKDEKYLSFIVDFIDFYVYDDGIIMGYDIEKYSTDDVCESRILFDLYRLTSDIKYLKAIEYTRMQLIKQPRTPEGNFWHKKIYPNQVWLDGLYMMMPFYIQYENYLDGKKNYPDIIKQFQNVRQYMFDENKKLYYHGFDSTKSIFWADKNTGLSKSFWLRSIGWYIVALIDVIGYIEKENQNEIKILSDIFIEAINGLLLYQDEKTKLFYDVVDMGNAPGNYLETSGSSMIAYAILKGTRLMVLPENYKKIGIEIFDSICVNFLEEDDGDLNLKNICLVSGLGPEDNLRRDGTYEYYISEPIVENDAKG